MGSLPANGIANSASRNSAASTASCIIPSPFRERAQSRSPVESPPLSKKPLHLAETGRPTSKTTDGTISCFLGARKLETGKENRSILKTDSPRKIKRMGEPSRKVNFRQKVLVFHFDREEGGHVCSESLTLNNDTEMRKSQVAPITHRQNNHSINFTASNAPVSSFFFQAHNASRNNIQQDARSSPKRNLKGTPLPNRRSLTSQKTPKESAIIITDFEFQYTVDESRNSILRFFIPLGAGLSASDVIVKANKAGNRVRVLATEPGAASSQRCREIGHRFGLPVRVDSYRIKARIDGSGMLYVEAPILPGEQVKSATRKTV